jgi:hypothetical protein
MPTDNKAIVRRLYEEVWNKRRLEVVNGLISPSHALNDPLATDSQSCTNDEWSSSRKAFPTYFHDGRHDCRKGGSCCLVANFRYAQK